VMRTPSPVLYDADYSFEFGKGHVLRQSPDDVAVIVSSGRGVHEALSARAQCEKSGVGVGVIDMPSIDEDLLVDLCESERLVCLAEQNNGYILQNLLKIQFRHRASRRLTLERVMVINALDAKGRARFIHSGTYEELTHAFGLTPPQIAKAITTRVKEMST
jgi:transketolase